MRRNHDNSTAQNFQEKSYEQPQGNRPVDTLWDGPLKMAIFENRNNDGVFFSTKPGRVYTDGQGHVQETNSFSHAELLRVSKLADKAYDRIGEFKQEMKVKNSSRDRER